jgi:hypothetical protein
VVDSDTKKRAYSPPSMTRPTLEEATPWVAVRKNCSEFAALDLLHSLHQELRRSEKTRELFLCAKSD